MPEASLVPFWSVGICFPWLHITILSEWISEELSEKEKWWIEFEMEVIYLLKLIKSGARFGLSISNKDFFEGMRSWALEVDKQRRGCPFSEMPWKGVVTEKAAGVAHRASLSRKLKFMELLGTSHWLPVHVEGKAQSV